MLQLLHAASLITPLRMIVVTGVIAGVSPRLHAQETTTPVERVTTPIEAPWRAALDEADRRELDRVEGYAAPIFPREPRHWRNTAPMTLEQMRGRVIVMQSLSTAKGLGLMTNRAITTAMEPVRDRATLVLIHTPDIRPTFETRLVSWKLNDPMIVDRDGTFCDALGIFQEPTTLVIDRHGIIRGTGLTPDGAAALAAQLADEPYVAERRGTPIPPRQEDTEDASATYPPFTGAIGRAEDIRGKALPMLNISEWLANEPTLTDRVIVVDFWATWCAPCVKGIPKLNELKRQFGERIAIIGITGESRRSLREGMAKINLEYSDFEYAVARDEGSHTQVSIRLTSLPHALVVGRDGIVRWQGHPQTLTPEILERIIRADGGQSMSGRWAIELVRRARQASQGSAQEKPSQP